MTNSSEYEEFTKNWTLSQKIKFYYEVDISNFDENINDVIRHISHDVTRVQQFEKDFKQYLIEREYINE
jgi:hypothetical protein